MTVVSWTGALFCGMILLVSACRPDIARQEHKERQNALFRKAFAHEQAGNLDDAIGLYGQILLDYPRLASAHLQLALLLHDHRQDYIAAIHHYRSYLALRSDSQKDAMIHDRIRIAEQLLAAQLVRRVGGDAIANVQAKQLAEIERLNRQLVSVQGERDTLSDARNALERQVKSLTGEADRLRRLLDHLRMPSTPASEHQARPSALPRRVPPSSPMPDPVPRERPASPSPTASRPIASQPSREPPSSDQATVRDARPRIEPVSVEQLVPTPIPPAPDRMANALVAPQPLESPLPPASAVMAPTSAFASDIEPRLRDPDTSATPRQPSTRTYVVQPGDTLSRIAEQFYGDAGQWKKLRDANSAQIDLDGHVRAGQILWVP